MRLPRGLLIGRASLHGPLAGDAGAQRLRLAHLLERVETRPPGRPPSAILLVRSLGPLPGGSELGPLSGPGSGRLVVALQSRLNECWAKAVRPRMGQVPPGTEALWFLDEAEFLAFLSLGRRERWWWEALPEPGGLFPLLSNSPEALPGALLRLVEWGEAGRVLGQLALPEARRLLEVLRTTFRLSGSLTLPSGVAGAAPAPWEPDGLTPALLQRLGPERGWLLRTAVAVARAPGALRGGSAAALAVQAPAREEAHSAARVQPVAAPPVHEGTAETHSAALSVTDEVIPSRIRRGTKQVLRSAEPETFTGPFVTNRPSDLHQETVDPPPVHPSALIASVGPEPVEGGPVAVERSASRAEATSAEPSPRLLRQEGTPLSEEVAAADQAEAPSTEAVPGGRTVAEPAEEHARPTPLVSSVPVYPTTPNLNPEEPLQTGLGGVLYLLNLLARHELPERDEATWGLASGLGLTGLLRVLAGPLLPEAERDPLWAILASLEGFDLEQPLGATMLIPVQPTDTAVGVPTFSPWFSPTGEALQEVLSQPLTRALQAWMRQHLPPLLSDLAGAIGAPPDQLAPYLQIRGRLWLTETHLDLELSIEEIRLPIRLAGLDANPGWVPALRRVVSFHFR